MTQLIKMKMRFKILITVLSLIIFSAEIYSQGTWERIDSPTDQFLKSVHFVDSLYGWAAGYSGTIIHTSDGGDNWIVQDSKIDYEIVDVFFLHRNLGWAIADKSDAPPYGTYILKTTNGGVTWQNSAYRDENIFMNCVLFLDSLTGWMGGGPHALVKTTDGGINWEQADIDSTNLAFLPVYSIKFFNDRYGYACGGVHDAAGVAWRTSNGGEKWYPIKPEDAPADPIQEIHTIDSLNVIGISGDIEGWYGIDVIRTSDGGVFWEYETLTHRGDPHDLDFRSDTEVWAPLGSDRVFIVSTDASTTWVHAPSPDSTAIYDLIFPDSLHGFAVGEEGAILKYNPPIVDDVKVITQTTLNGYQLYQNYPNPFNPTTKIKFSIPTNEIGEASNVKIIVLDILGNEVATILDKELLPGSYKIEFGAMIDNRQLVSGIYFYQLRAGGYIQTKKMLIVK